MTYVFIYKLKLNNKKCYTWEQHELYSYTNWNWIWKWVACSRHQRSAPNSGDMDRVEIYPPNRWFIHVHAFTLHFQCGNQFSHMRVFNELHEVWPLWQFSARCVKPTKVRAIWMVARIMRGYARCAVLAYRPLILDRWIWSTLSQVFGYLWTADELGTQNNKWLSSVGIRVN